MKMSVKGKKNASNIVEYAILLALVGIVAGLAFWNMSEDDNQTFRNYFKSIWGNKAQEQTDSSLKLTPMTD